MVSTLQMTGMIMQILICLVFPIVILIYLKRKAKLSWKSFFIGFAIFIIFAQILEQLLHITVLDLSGPSLKWTDSKIAFVLYGAFAAGIFEEIGRYFGFKALLKRNRDYHDGISFGLGHGSIEALLIGVIGAINALVLASLINSGLFDQMVGSTMPSETAAQLKSQYINSSFALYMLAGLERVFAILIHIAFSLIVLLGVREGKFKYVLYAVGLHALVDIAPAMYQVGMLKQIWVIESILAVFGVLALVFIIRVRGRLQE